MANIYSIKDYPNDFVSFTMMCTAKWLGAQITSARSCADLKKEAEVVELRRLFRRCSRRRSIKEKRKLFADGLDELKDALFFQELGEHEEEEDRKRQLQEEAGAIQSPPQLLQKEERFQKGEVLQDYSGADKSG
ncbi:hypothetical protein [Utkilio virus]|nr:hypothetical protein [Utkilio virus]